MRLFGCFFHVCTIRSVRVYIYVTIQVDIIFPQKSSPKTRFVYIVHLTHFQLLQFS